MKKIVLGGGCFWGMEAYFKRFDGVIKTEVGYANGHTVDPTYQEVCSNTTGHAEVLWLEYDPEVISLDVLLEHLWKVIDPTSLNRQGGDIGSQYRTGVYYFDASDVAVINASKAKEQEKHEKPIVTEIEPLKCYFAAEEYHQDYLKKNPNGYCHIKLD
ncbi:peptide-methionine (S)-S-oxide reductase MsrA [Fusibacter bizertensis]|jgi:methionine-S-sulfoxide reductase|uniref:Peptide methionine sulfoxide reductase MsrA n=1 Tax=Fusibacter bizertensis TaxID=1488331 RepID=A0ABT6NC54_9FIRM|nr:peptide-methionine (S)-S-oxide reductase MsrA [Fusibacter bizertensis]MDH8677994.1 peptide-methionine (S)-S-oxide reductase MsrA [Fusibacter bizertensis]